MAQPWSPVKGVYKGMRVRAKHRIGRPQGGPGYMPVVIGSGTKGQVVTVSDRMITVVFDAPKGNAIQWTGPEKAEGFRRDVAIIGRKNAKRSKAKAAASDTDQQRSLRAAVRRDG